VFPKGLPPRELKILPAQHNILLEDERDGTPILADFGRSIFSDRGSTTALAGSPRYMTPELIASFPLLINYNEIDVFGFSVVVLEVSDLLFILMFCVIFGISSAMIDHRPFTPIWLRCRVIPDYTLPVRV
jgi:serine/threonine protein kinase